MIPANHDSRIEAQQLPRERFSPLAESRGSQCSRKADDG